MSFSLAGSVHKNLIRILISVNFIPSPRVRDPILADSMKNHTDPKKKKRSCETQSFEYFKVLIIVNYIKTSKISGKYNDKHVISGIEAHGC